jgi:hypothetical protein
MPEGEATNAELDALIANLTGAGKGADFFQTALKQVSSQLGQAKAAAAAAQGALAEGNAQYRELEKAANLAAKAVEKAGAKGVIDPKLSAESARADAALQSYAQTLKSLEQDAAAATKSEAAFATQLANVKKLAGHVDKSFNSNAETLGKLQGSLGAVGGPLGALGQKIVGPVKGFQELSGAIGASNAAMLLGAAAVVGVIAAFVALAAAVVAGTIAIAAWAVGLADAARSAKLTKEAAEALVPGLVEMRQDFAALNKATGASDAQMRGWVKQLDAAKVKAEDLPDALRAVALSSAALGQEGVSEYFEQLKDAKGAVSDLSATVNSKLGPIVAKQMRGLDAQAAAFKKNISSLFGGLNIEPVLAGLERLGALFDQNTAAGETIKFLFESVFQPLIDQADRAALVIEAFALGFLIGMTKVYIAIKPAIKAVSEFFGFEDTSLSDLLAVATKAGEYAAYIFLGFVAAIAAVAAIIGVVVAISIAWTAAIYGAIAAVVYFSVQLISGVIGAFEAVKTYLSEIDLAETGAQILQGLANGITGAAGFVKDAVSNAVKAAIKSAKDLLGIASPSKVFAEIGGYTGEGFAGGVEAAAPDAQAAMTDMVDPAPAAAKSKQGAAAEGGSSGGAPTVHIENLYLAGAKASKAETLSLSEALTRLIQGDAAALGGGDPEPATP